MNVSLLGFTTIVEMEIENQGMELSDTQWTANHHAADVLAEFAGRSCYQSFHRPNPATRSNKDYLNNILDQEHYSVLEHASATFYITGVSRSLTHELIRHRHLSYSQLSQRFVDANSTSFVRPPNLPHPIDNYIDLDTTLDVYDSIVQQMTETGYTRKEAREAARAILPNATETRIVVTGNHRAWREFLLKRLNRHADAEIQQLAKELLVILKRIAPNTYQDFDDLLT